MHENKKYNRFNFPVNVAMSQLLISHGKLAEFRSATARDPVLQLPRSVAN